MNMHLESDNCVFKTNGICGRGGPRKTLDEVVKTDFKILQRDYVDRKFTVLEKT